MKKTAIAMALMMCMSTGVYADAADAHNDEKAKSIIGAFWEDIMSKIDEMIEQNKEHPNYDYKEDGVLPSGRKYIYNGTNDNFTEFLNYYGITNKTICGHTEKKMNPYEVAIIGENLLGLGSNDLEDIGILTFYAEPEGCWVACMESQGPSYAASKYEECYTYILINNKTGEITKHFE